MPSSAPKPPVSKPGLYRRYAGAGARYRDAHSGMSGPNAAMRRVLQAMVHPRWALDVGVLGKPHDLGNISVYRGAPTKLEDYIGWLGQTSIRPFPGKTRNGSASSGKVR